MFRRDAALIANGNPVLDFFRHCTATLPHELISESLFGTRPFLDEIRHRVMRAMDKNAMKNPDEPLFDKRETTDNPSATTDPAARESIQHLVDKQPYAVLCVQGGGQPYGALVAFAFSDDLRHAVFVTPMATRKFRLLSECDHVAFVIDDRPKKAEQLMEIEAVTVTGRAQMIERGWEFDRWAELLLTRHPYLKSFVNATTCALFRVDIVRFLHVARFQEVRQWIPGTRS
jgi:uncharacterized protein YhbP (UPF0306 family)